MFTKNVLTVDAQNLAKKTGSVITENIVMLGAAAATHGFPLTVKALENAIKELVPPRFLDINLKAFRLGHKAVKKG